MRTAAITCLLSVSLLSGCGEEARTPGPPVPLKSFVLHDVQGLYGGRALWASGDRTAVVQVVGPPPAGQTGLWEKRYKVKLTDEHWAEVERLVGAHHFLTVMVPERPGVPDEAHPIVMVVTKTGTTFKAMKWANDEHPDFDPVYGYLLGLCRASGVPVHEGPFDWEWRPEGFDRPW